LKDTSKKQVPKIKTPSKTNEMVGGLKFLGFPVPFNRFPGGQGHTPKSNFKSVFVWRNREEENQPFQGRIVFAGSLEPVAQLPFSTLGVSKIQ
jgi:hypothetical protein